MEVQKTEITLSNCTVYNCPTPDSPTITVELRSGNGELLVCKQIEIVSIKGEIRFVLGFKVTFTPQEKQIVLSLADVGQCFVDLQLLRQVKSHCYEVNHPVVIKISTEEEKRGSKLEGFTMSRRVEDNSEFIKQRELFLQGLKRDREEEGMRSLLKTPEFPKEGSPDDKGRREGSQRQKDSFHGKIEELLAKTKRLKEEQLSNRSSRYQHDAFAKGRSSKLMPAFELLEEEVSCPIRPTVHEHHHISSPIEAYSSPYKQFEKTQDVEALICRTNDSESINNSRQEPQPSPHPCTQPHSSQSMLFNAKVPFKRSHK